MGSNALIFEGSSSQPDAFASTTSPLQHFFFFHKAIRVALERLSSDAHAAENGGECEFQLLQRRFELLRLIYAQHSNAEDEVLFPALDSRVKNIAPTYSLEHKEEDGLFDSMSKLLSCVQTENSASLSKNLKREFRRCAKAIQTSLCKHMSKEELQVFPLLLKHFNTEEQAALVWQFLCRIPVNLLQKLLPWIASSLSEREHKSMVSCMRAVVPKDDLLQHVVLNWLSVAPMQKRHDVDITEIVYNSRLSKRETSTFRKRGKRSAHNLDYAGAAFEGCLRLPVSDLIFWHTSLGKEFMKFTEYARRLQVSEMEHAEKLSLISKKLKFLMEMRKFYSAAEDNILSPLIFERANHGPSFVLEHIEEELEVRKFVSFLEGMHDADTISIEESVDLLCNRAACIAQDVEKHLRGEVVVFPLIQKYFNVQEQQALCYDCLCMLPLKVLEKMLPWLGSLLSEEDLNNMLQNLKQGGPANDEAFASLLVGWAIGGKNEYLGEDEILTYPLSVNLDERRSVRRRFACGWDTTTAHDHFSVTLADSQRTSIEMNPDYKENVSTGAECLPFQSCCSVSSCSSTYGGSCFFVGDCTESSQNKAAAFKPIDCIFQFHKAIQRDLEYLDRESEKIADCDDEFLRQFKGRFMLLWSLYRAHSNAEDDIVFPALEARETLHNVSHSYVIDHEKEEQLFKDISSVLTQLSDLHEYIKKQPYITAHNSAIDEGQFHSGGREETSRQKLSLSVKLQDMCKSIQINLNQHISREERELWPLLSTHFSIQEQEKIVGRIIGTTGAEVLQSMIPWVTAALSLEEQSNMFDTWLLAARNTMFDQWLGSLFPSSPIQSPRILTLSQSSTVQQDDLPQNGNSECLQMLAEYLTKDNFSGGSAEKTDESVECIKGLAGVSCDLPLQDGKKKEDAEAEYPSESASCHQMDGMDQNYSCISEKSMPYSKDDQGSAGFKAGWQDIFRMNQKELEAAVRKVSNDGSLDPRKKAYLMQNLMTSRWIVAQQKQPYVREDGKDVPGCDPSFHDQEMKVFGCEHYKRNCKLLASCCGLLFTCRFCHDNVSDHTMDRQATKEMMCMKCLKIQPVAQHCSTPSCNFLMARYYCGICKFFDDDIKDIYHCPYCNICRVGKGLGIDFFHCMTCNACMNVSLKNHKCREKGLESNCPICHDFMFTSKAPVKALSCGHFMHSACFQAFTSYHYTCPICCKSVGDMSVYFGMLDGLLAGEELPEEYKERKQEILCNDCEQKGTAPFHWLYHKCSKCGSYNTRVL